MHWNFRYARDAFNLAKNTDQYYNFLEPNAVTDGLQYKMIRARVIGDPKLIRIRKNFTMTTVRMEDSFRNVFEALWYNQPYVKNTIKFGEEYFVYGKDDKKKKNTLGVTQKQT